MDINADSFNCVNCPNQLGEHAFMNISRPVSAGYPQLWDQKMSYGNTWSIGASWETKLEPNKPNSHAQWHSPVMCHREINEIGGHDRWYGQLTGHVSIPTQSWPAIWAARRSYFTLNLGMTSDVDRPPVIFQSRPNRDRGYEQLAGHISFWTSAWPVIWTTHQSYFIFSLKMTSGRLHKTEMNRYWARSDN